MMALIMNKVWLAVLFGLLIGLGAGMIPVAQLASPPRTQSEPEVLMQTGNRPAAVRTSSDEIQPVILALLVGLLVAAPLFLVARRRWE